MSLDEFFSLIHHAAHCTQCRTYLYGSAEFDDSGLCNVGRGLTPSVCIPYPTTPEHEALKLQCEEIGLIYQGVQSGVPELGLEPLVLFAQDTFSTTRSLPVSQFSKDAALSRFDA